LGRCILDRELVQSELLLHLGQFLRRCVLERHPNEAAGPVEIEVDVLLRNIGELPAFLIGNAVDEHDASF
jgi:hypothetical protein